MTAAMPERRPATEQISGVIERVTLNNDDSGFCVPIRSKCWFPASHQQPDKITIAVAVRNPRRWVGVI